MKQCLTQPPHYLYTACSSSLQHAAKLRTLRWKGRTHTLYTSGDVCCTLPPYTILLYALLGLISSLLFTIDYILALPHPEKVVSIGWKESGPSKEFCIPCCPPYKSKRLSCAGMYANYIISDHRMSTLRSAIIPSWQRWQA